ncbi:tetratricopeptide repeat protein [Brevibacillus fluminis]|uniref:Tetratricopeptide repeat protein n=1 Tax=Brevibacillus fluminis TaxID=511487 RepID=A0A3M8DZ64_9BACL|nr:tetratricopeptide repeat protein [Brevibacillus fluminis]RNB92521.1 tetratricopeptide repeat protein [Brevibacillus fluminis]
MIEEEKEFVPYHEEKALREKLNAALKRGDQVDSKIYRESLVSLYVLFGESFKMSDRPDPNSAKRYLEKALRLQSNHPIANYRYAHILYGSGKYIESACFFKRALDGNREQGLSDTQTLIAQIFTVNCGILMAKDAIKEVNYLESSKYASFDSKIIANYADRMLVDSEEMLTQYLYIKVTSTGSEPISEDFFYKEQESKGDCDVLICITQQKRELVYQDRREPLTQTEFFVAHTVLMSNEFIQVKDIYEYLCNGPLGGVIKPESIRKCLSRLVRNPIWNVVVETNARGNYSARRRRVGLQYALLCHSNVVVP